MTVHTLGKDGDKNESLSKRFCFYNAMVKIHSVLGKGKPVMKRLEKRMGPNKEDTQVPYFRV